MDSTELALLAGTGDAEAFAELYNKERPLLKLWLAARIAAANRDDVEQDVWLHLWESLPSFKGKSNFAIWFRALKHNRYVQFVRKDSTYCKYISMMVFDEEYEQEMDCCADLISMLPHAVWRDAAMQHYVMGLKYTEIGAITGETADAIRSRCRRSIDWFQAHPHLY